MWEKPSKQVQRVARSGSFFLNYIDLLKKIRTEHQETVKMCFRPQRGAFSGVLHAHAVASKTRCFPQREACSADFAGRCSICVARTKLTEGERVVPLLVALPAF